MTDNSTLAISEAEQPKSSAGRRLVALFAAAGMLVAACGDSSDGDDAADTPVTTTEAADDAMEDDAMEDEEAMEDDAMEDEEAMEADMLGAFGPACGAVPTEGEGSFAGMADDTAATAASNNPLLSTLVTAVVEADLVDTLNSDGPFTIFAPTNDAFAALPPEDLDAVLADKDLLTSVLTFHVIGGESMSIDDLVAAGSATTVNGADLTFAAEGEGITINGASSTICMNVPTANATVHIIDQVLLPAAE